MSNNKVECSNCKSDHLVRNFMIQTPKGWTIPICSICKNKSLCETCSEQISPCPLDFVGIGNTNACIKCGKWICYDCWEIIPRCEYCEESHFCPECIGPKCQFCTRGNVCPICRPYELINYCELCQKYFCQNFCHKNCELKNKS